MKTNYVLIDFENVQPKSLQALEGQTFKVLVFVGANQTKVPINFARTMQAMGDDAEYIQIGGNGPNALDFHIAYYIGQLAASDSDSYFHIISKDTGFDPLIKHLKQNKILVQRHKQILDIPLLKISNSKTQPERIEAILNFLSARGPAKPRTVKTLSNSIDSLFSKKLGEDELNGLVQELATRKNITVDGAKIRYHL